MENKTTIGPQIDLVCGMDVKDLVASSCVRQNGTKIDIKVISLALGFDIVSHAFIVVCDGFIAIQKERRKSDNLWFRTGK